MGLLELQMFRGQRSNCYHIVSKEHLTKYLVLILNTTMHMYTVFQNGLLIM